MSEHSESLRSIAYELDDLETSLKEANEDREVKAKRILELEEELAELEANYNELRNRVE